MTQPGIVGSVAPGRIERSTAPLAFRMPLRPDAADTADAVAFSPDGTLVAIASASAQRVALYPYDLATGLGVKLPDPAVLPTGQGNAVAFSPDGAFLAVGHSTSPFITVYPVTAAGLGAKLADPAALPPGTVHGVEFTPDQAYIACAHAVTPFVTAWAFTGVFGAAEAPPASLPPDTGRSLAFNPRGWSVAVGHSTTPFVTMYSWGPSGFSWGGKRSDPGTLPGAAVFGVSWREGEDFLACAVSGADVGVVAYEVLNSIDLGVQYQPAVQPDGTKKAVRFSADGAYVCYTGLTAPYMSVYKFTTAARFGELIAAPALPPADRAEGCDWHPHYGHLAIASQAAAPAVYPLHYASRDDQPLTPTNVVGLLAPISGGTERWALPGTYP